jgi:hypothetical protein
VGVEVEMRKARHRSNRCRGFVVIYCNVKYSEDFSGDMHDGNRNISQPGNTLRYGELCRLVLLYLPHSA